MQFDCIFSFILLSNNPVYQTPHLQFVTTVMTSLWHLSGYFCTTWQSSSTATEDAAVFTDCVVFLGTSKLTLMCKTGGMPRDSVLFYLRALYITGIAVMFWLAVALFFFGFLMSLCMINRKRKYPTLSITKVVKLHYMFLI